ncbi:hypothetical protein [Deinococcus sp. QL22]|uniref:hypothetical protein n=1 Tax=Deinococcus sp. QL22 TaxID=2939437 RepID=UPI0020181CDC|nr:hypothetical protein [Deinococcus sp. QL22]UQN06748.1 hypothetical protein M1R55_02165 [Deinococcus sp. QL22]
MTFKSAQTPTRRAERAALRAGPRWHWSDAIPIVMVLLHVVGFFLSPALLADIGDTVIGPTQYLESLDGSLSGVILAGGRFAVAALVLYTLWYVREAPWSTRMGWAIIASALLLNCARNVYTGAPATFSFLEGQAGLLWLLFRLAVRPTVWQQMTHWKERAERAEAELAQLKGTL